ncbi:MAG: hypothetical protein PHC50_08560 [Candidatus Cloacimonetes bacterium]|nr:hypothetical protein [Candidatus Cloacimonadota bacterium]
MKALKYILLNKIAKKSRAEQLTLLIHLFVSGKINEKQLMAQLEKLYNRSGEARNTLTPQLLTLNSQLSTGKDPLYQQIYQSITSTYPKKEGLEAHQIESYANTVSARAATTERSREYQNRGVHKVQIVAYLDHATTDICRMMHGRVFELGPAMGTLSSQEPLVHSENFWAANDHFSQSPSAEMTPWLPPYHYNCRTRIIPYIQPKDPYAAALDSYYNLSKMPEKQIAAVVDHAARLEFASPEKLSQHSEKHQAEYGITTNAGYLNEVKKLLKNPLKQMALAISARDRSLTLYVWDPKVRLLDGVQKHDFAVFDLDNNILKTLHAKPMDKILKNLNPEKHGKVMILTDQYTSKGVKMVGEHCVKQYEYIIDYLKDDDSTDIQEIYNREGMEEEWDSIPEPLKQRILAVDKIVLERYADYFDYQIFKDYIKMIRARLQMESEKGRS